MRVYMICSQIVVYTLGRFTPLSVFSDKFNEVLNYEGPQTINTGLALAVALSADEVVLVGVDLGAKDLENTRSSNAAGESPRDFALKVKGNFGGYVHTDSLMEDGRLAAEACLEANKDLNVFNMSDGVYIEGATPITPSDYLTHVSDNLEHYMEVRDEVSSLHDQWWSSLQKYSTNRFIASWESRRPRAHIYSFFRDLEAWLKSYDGNMHIFVQKLNPILDLNVSVERQFPRRLVRSTLFKFIAGVYREWIVMSHEPEKRSLFVDKALSELLHFLVLYESEMYQLCDYLETL